MDPSGPEAGVIPCTLSTMLAIVLVLLSLGTAIGAAVLLGLSPWWRPWLGHWLPLVDLGALLVLYGVLSGLTVRAIASWRPLPSGFHAPLSPAWGRWQLLTVITMFGQWSLRPFCPSIFRPLMARLYGARIGAGAVVAGSIDEPWMVAVGEGTVLGNSSLVSGHLLTGGRLLLGRVEIGAGVLVGAQTIVTPGCRLGDRAQLQAGGVLMPRSAIAAGEIWRGNPAVPPAAASAASANPEECRIPKLIMAG